MISIKSANEQEVMRRGGKILFSILNELKNASKPGVKREEIDKLARKLCVKYKVKPSFFGYGSYPGAVCVSVNEEVVHGLPTRSVFNNGDLISLDMGVELGGFHTDSAISFICGNTEDERAKRLINVCEQGFYSGVDLIKNGVHLGDVSAKIQEVIEKAGYGVVRTLVGHGIGKEIHEDPQVPNYSSSGTGQILKTGMTIAIEPMIIEDGTTEVELQDDRWTYSTQSGARAAHYEHTVLVTDTGYEILTQ